MKSCVLTWALIWDEPALYTLYFDEVISVLLKAKNDLWVSWKSGLVRLIGLKFLPEVYLSRITHAWKFQPKRIILSGKSLWGGYPLNAKKALNCVKSISKRLIVYWINKNIILLFIRLFCFSFDLKYSYTFFITMAVVRIWK